MPRGLWPHERVNWPEMQVPLTMAEGTDLSCGGDVRLRLEYRWDPAASVESIKAGPIPNDPAHAMIADAILGFAEELSSNEQAEVRYAD